MGKLIEEYIGDGVYASWDGCQLWLDCRGQSGFTIGPMGQRAIALEPSVLRELDRFLERVRGYDPPHSTSGEV
jgi:hypothetical protein